MSFGLNTDKFSDNQIRILKLLFKRDYLQHELQKVLSTSGSNLHYHIIRLEKYNLVRKEMVQRVGNAIINKISLNPSARQYIRKILGFKVKNYTLITGFGTLRTGYRLPDIVFKILKENFYPISRIVCFTSPDAIIKRKENQEQENLLRIDEYIEYNYEDYRNLKSNFFKKVETIISEEMKTADIIIDLTPLSKLFSFKLLEMANKYYLPCVYLGVNNKDNYELLSMSEMKITGLVQHLN